VRSVFGPGDLLDPLFLRLSRLSSRLRSFLSAHFTFVDSFPGRRPLLPPHLSLSFPIPCAGRKPSASPDLPLMPGHLSSHFLFSIASDPECTVYFLRAKFPLPFSLPPDCAWQAARSSLLAFALPHNDMTFLAFFRVSFPSLRESEDAHFHTPDSYRSIFFFF